MPVDTERAQQGDDSACPVASLQHVFGEVEGLCCAGQGADCAVCALS